MNPSFKIVVSQRFAVPAERVYDAWLNPEWISRWMFGPEVRDERIGRLRVEPRVGGKFSFVVERQGATIDHAGEYLELDRPDLLVFTWGTSDSRPATSRVVVEIVPCAGGCELTFTHVMSTESAVFTDSAANAWRTRLAALARALVQRTHPLILKAS